MDDAPRTPEVRAPVLDGSLAGRPAETPAVTDPSSRSSLGVFAWCPMCDGPLAPEHAHYRCTGCGWRDSCCD